MDLGLQNLNVLITGGSRGIGRACAEVFAREGANVSICARNTDEVAQARQDLSDIGVTAFGDAFDVSDKARLEKWIHDSAAALGGVDIVIANASAMVAEATESAWQTAFETDLMHSVRLTETALPYLRKSRHGAITFITSISAREADGTAAPYGVFKLALHRYAKDLAVTLASDGIRANTIAPGTTYFDGGVWQWVETNDPEMFAGAKAANPMGRMATPQEIAQSIVFLSSPASSFTTGANLVVDGAITKGVQV